MCELHDETHTLQIPLSFSFKHCSYKDSFFRNQRLPKDQRAQQQAFDLEIFTYLLTKGNNTKH